LKNVGNQIKLMYPIDFHRIFFIQLMGYINCLVTDIVQNIFLCVQQNKLIQVLNNLRVCKNDDRIFILNLK